MSIKKYTLQHQFLGAGLLVLAGLLVYANSLLGVFLLDDIDILNNPRLHHLWPLSDVVGGTNRPLLNLSLALNYAIGKNNVWGYHIFNISVHLAAALVLMAILRRTFLSPRLAAAYAARSTVLSFFIALLWLVHPLQTASVTYVVQRAESLMGLLFLTSFYGALRYMENDRHGLWAVGSVVSCALAVCVKEVAVTAPIMILIYDRIFWGHSFREVLSRRWRLYLGLAAAWGVSLFLLQQTDFYRASVGFYLPGVSWMDYARTQPNIISHYLRLAVWPAELCFDYFWQPVKDMREAWGGCLVVGGLLMATILFLRFNPLWGFLGVWFFGILAVTSSFIPLADLAFEHRMYLPLAAVMTLLVLGGEVCLSKILRAKKVCQSLGVVLVVVMGLVFSGLTISRNRDYHSEVGMLQDVLEKRPQNVRALNDLGLALIQQKKIAEGRKYLLAALSLSPANPLTHNHLGLALYYEGRPEEAIGQFMKALEWDPDYEEPVNNLGLCYAALGKRAQAREQYLKAIDRHPDFAEAYNNLAALLLDQGEYPEAIFHCRRAIALKPHYETPYNNAGAAALLSGDLVSAEKYLKQALALKADYPKALNNLGVVYKMQEKFALARGLFEEALRLDPVYIQAQRNLAEVSSK